MKQKLTATVLAIIGWPAVAQPTNSSETLEAMRAAPAETRWLNSVGVNYRFPINVTVDFKGIGGFRPLGVPVPGRGNQPGNPGSDTGATENRTYEDGYTWVDISTNAGGMTWFWGYNDLGAQGEPAGNPRSIVLQSSSSETTSLDDRKDNMVAGFEMTYSRELFRKKRLWGGLEFGFGYNDYDVTTTKTVYTDVQRIRDTYSLPESEYSQPLPQSYQGTFEGPTVPGFPGRLTFSEPQRNRTVISDGSVIEGRRHFDANLFGFRLGPNVYVPITKKVALSLGAGLSVLFVDSDFDYAETVTIPGVGAVTHRSGGSDSDWLVGGYLSAGISAEFAKRWSVFGGAQFHTMGDYTHKEGGQKAVLNIGNSFFITAGISYAF